MPERKIRTARNSAGRGILIAAVSLIFMLAAVLVWGKGAAAEALPQEAGEFLYTNPETGYSVYIEDGAGILTEEEEQALVMEDMAKVTAYGSAGFISTLTDQPDIEQYAADRYAALFGRGSGTLLVVNMNRRVIALHSNGEVYKTIDRNTADTIMDNVYRLASKGAYYDMASNAFLQVRTRMEGGRISQPMKYITNALLALILALLMNYIFVRIVSASFRPSRRELLDALQKRENVADKSVVLRSTSKRYDPVQSSSSGSGSGGGSGGGGGGGGGGGSHSF